VTSTEPARKPTAKEIAEAAEALAQEALTTSQQVLAEVRDLKESGGPATVATGGTDAATLARLEKLDGDIDGLVSNLNTLSAAVHAAPMAADGTPLDLSTVVVEMRKAFTEHAQKIDANNEAARKAIAEIRQTLDSGAAGAAVGMLTRLGAEVEELKGQVQTFSEAGVAPASAEDIDGLDGRLRTVESYLNADTPAAVEYGTASPSNAPDGVPAVYRQMHQLMLKVSEIGKDSQASEDMGGYKFRSIEAAMTAVGHALREVGMMFVPREIVDHKVKQYEITKTYRNGGSSIQNWTHVWVRQRYAFVSLIDGSTIEGIEMDGEARDNGDKSTSKADSMRYKYALLQALCIPTVGLPESDGSASSEGPGEESWESARTREEIEQDKRRQQQAAEPERGHTVEDEPQAPPEGYEEARQQGQPLAEQKPVDDRTDDEKAQAVVKALRDLNSVAPNLRRARFERIAKAVIDQHLGSLMVEGITINRHLSATNATLGGNG
jgi:hypothetical protein